MMNWNIVDAQADPIIVNVPDQPSFFTDLDRYLAQGRGFSVATINLDHVVKLSQDSAFRRAYSAHTHVTADGNPIVWLSRLSGQSNITLMPGSELILPISNWAAQNKVPIALFGATDVSLQAAAAALQTQISGLNIVLCLAPPMGFDPNGVSAEDAITQLRDSGARIVFLALGAPKQECFAIKAMKELPQTGFLSIGAGLDFIAGSQTRAPHWVRTIKLEWLWRMLGNPRRLARRYGACIAILPRLTWLAWCARR